MARLLPPERDIGVLQAPVGSCLALTGMFLAVLLAVGLLERIGIGPGASLMAVVGSAFALFALAALLSHSRRAADFYVADRKVSGAFGGLAAAGSFAGLIALGLAGGAYGSGAEVFVTAAGLAAGFVILALLIAPRLRASGAYTPGDFLAARFGGFWARLAWAAVAFSVSFLLLVAHLKIAGALITMFFRTTPEHALYVAAGLTAMAALPGGMRSLTWTQAIQYFVIALACLVPSGFLAFADPTLESLIARESGMPFLSSMPPWSAIASAQSPLPVLLAAFGAASLPHLLARTLTTRSTREAGAIMVWGMLFAVVLVGAGIVLADFLARGMSGQIGGMSQLAGLLEPVPAVLAGLILAGTLAALFALGEAALFSAATALSHDIYDEILDRRGAEGRRIFIARLIVIAVAAAAVFISSRWQAEATALLQWALALAAAGCFAPLVLGLWWRRCNEVGAVGGMLAGFGFAGLVFLLKEHLVPETMVSSGWAGLDAPAAAMLGLLVSSAVTIGLSLVTPAQETNGQPVGAASGDRRDGPPIRERPA